MLQAAQLALDAPGAPPLDALDTAGLPGGAAAAAQKAIQGGAGLILGPLTSADTAAVAPVARGAGVGVLAFTSDGTQAQPGVWTLGITPAQQVRRLVASALTAGQTRFAALVPDDPLGNALADALGQATGALGAQPPTVQRYSGGFAQLNQAARAVSDYANRRGPLDAQIRAARALDNGAGRQQVADLMRQPVPPPPFDTLLLGATGEHLQEVISLLPYYDIAPPAVHIIGPGLWEANAARLGALAGARYAAPDPAARASFVASFSAKYGAPPPGLADLAYDAAAIARVTAAQGGFSAASLTRPDGYAGVDGVLGLLADGHVRRGLAIFEIGHGGAQIVDPAPTALSASGV
jgi:hypothetical protein